MQPSCVAWRPPFGSRAVFKKGREIHGSDPFSKRNCCDSGSPSTVRRCMSFHSHRAVRSQTAIDLRHDCGCCVHARALKPPRSPPFTPSFEPHICVAKALRSKTNQRPSPETPADSDSARLFIWHCRPSVIRCRWNVLLIDKNNGLAQMMLKRPFFLCQGCDGGGPRPPTSSTIPCFPTYSFLPKVEAFL